MGTTAGLTHDRRGLALVLVAYAGVCAWALATDEFLNDEGLLTHLFAAITARDFPAAFFLQKTRPPISALYAPFAAWGITPFFVAHVVVGAAGIVMLRGAAIAMGQRLPNVVAGVLALSPLFVGGAVAGLSNTDAVVGVCAYAWLHARGRDVAAAIVVGVLVFVRAELAVLAVVVAGHAAIHRRWVMVAGLAAFGVVYGLAGAVYHGDLLWQLHFPPALPEAMPGNPYWETHSGRLGAGDFVRTCVAITPLVPALALVSWRQLGVVERIGVVFVLLFVLALVVLPMWRVFNFDQSPRYLLPVLPFVALAVGRVLEGWSEPSLRRIETPALAAAAGLAVAGAMEAPHPTGLIAVGVVALALAAARAGRARVAVGLAIVVVLLGPRAFSDGAKVDRRSNAPHLSEMVDRLRELPAEPRDVYTNEPLLAVYVARHDLLPWARIHYLVQADQSFELDRLANADNGQRDALWAALDHDFYGVPVRSVSPDAIEPGSIFALRLDARLDLALPPDVWGPHLVELHPGYGTVISRFEEVPP